MTRVKVLVSAVMMVALLVVLSGCVMGQVTTQVLTEDPQKIENTLQIINRALTSIGNWQDTGYLYGVILQKSWQKSRGWKADPYNQVRLLVQLPSKEIRVVIPNGRTEHFAAVYLTPGDIIGFKDKESYYEETYHQLGIEEFILVVTGQSNGLTKFTTTNTQ